MSRALCALGLCLVVAACGDNLDANAVDGNNNGGGDAADNDGTVAIDGAAETDAAVGVACGAATCTAGMECCIQGMGRTCVAQGSCNGQNFDCDGNEDCATAGDVCCSGGGMGMTGGTTCVAAASCPMPTCGSSADCTVAPNTMCCAIGSIQACLAACP